MVMPSVRKYIWYAWKNAENIFGMLEIVRLRMGVGAPCNSFKFLHLPGNKA
jgi:hypothetical protein